MLTKSIITNSRRIQVSRQNANIYVSTYLTISLVDWDNDVLIFNFFNYCLIARITPAITNWP